MSNSLEEHIYLGEKTKMPTKGLNFKATELRLGLPGSESPERVKKFNDDDVGNGNFELSCGKNMSFGVKRGFSDKLKSSSVSVQGTVTVVSSKAQVVGWPPVRSFRKNSMAINPPKTNDNQDCKLEFGCHYVKVSMDGAPYLRKIDLKTYASYVGLSSALEKMFSGFTMGQYGSKGLPCPNEGSERSEYALTYEDKDGDWMLVGDVPWNMFLETCRRLRIMKSSEAVGLTSRAGDGLISPLYVKMQQS